MPKKNQKQKSNDRRAKHQATKLRPNRPTASLRDSRQPFVIGEAGPRSVGFQLDNSSATFIGCGGSGVEVGMSVSGNSNVVWRDGLLSASQAGIQIFQRRKGESMEISLKGNAKVIGGKDGISAPSGGATLNAEGGVVISGGERGIHVRDNIFEFIRTRVPSDTPAEFVHEAIEALGTTEPTEPGVLHELNGIRLGSYLSEHAFDIANLAAQLAPYAAGWLLK